VFTFSSKCTNAGLSFLAAADFAAEVPGLDQVPRENRPNVELTHFAFQIMVGSGTALMLLSLWFWWSWFRKRDAILQRRVLLWGIFLGAPLGFVGLEAGWFVTEVGRQPWVIQGVLRTTDSVTPAEGVFGLFIGFSILYLLLTVTVVVLLFRIAAGKSAEAKK